MTAAGFFRIEGYGLKARHQAGKQATPWRTIAGVAAEAARMTGAATHVKGTAAIELLFGEHPMVLAEIAAQQAQRARNQGTRKPGRLSPTASAIFGAVASFPESSRQRQDDHEFLERYDAWRERLLEWIKKRWGNFPISVVEHRDEEYWHVHALIVPPMDEQGRLLVGLVHPGYAARGELERAGRSSVPANEAYRAAMRALLDEYHREVGSECGHVRISSKPRQRLTRAQVMTDRRQRTREIELRQHERNLVVASEALQRRSAKLDAQIDALRSQVRGLDAERSDLERQRQRLEAEGQALRASSAAARSQLEADWAKKRGKLEIAAAKLRDASAAIQTQNQELQTARREAMTSDAVRLAAENAQLRSALAEALRRSTERKQQLDGIGAAQVARAIFLVTYKSRILHETMNIIAPFCF